MYKLGGVYCIIAMWLSFPGFIKTVNLQRLCNCDVYPFVFRKMPKERCLEHDVHFQKRLEKEKCLYYLKKNEVHIFLFVKPTPPKRHLKFFHILHRPFPLPSSLQNQFLRFFFRLRHIQQQQLRPCQRPETWDWSCFCCLARDQKTHFRESCPTFVILTVANKFASHGRLGAEILL